MCRTQNRWGLVLAVMAIGCVVAPKGSRAESPQRVKARKVVEKLKGTRIISIQDYDKMNAIDQEGMAGVWGDSPVNEYDRNYRKRLTEYLGITVIKKVSVYTGTVLDGDILYDDFANRICRNKMVVQIDHPKDCYMLPSDPKGGAFRNWWGSWGCHQVGFYGNLKENISEFASLTGFEVVGDK